MTTRPFAPVLHYLRQVRSTATDCANTDAGLLQQFAERGDEAAFATLLQRYGPMVFGVCRRVLRDRHDAEDAFQATFLLLVRKARSLRQPELLGHWLYGVAYRTALKAKSLAYRRASAATTLDEVAAAPSEDVMWRDLRPVLDGAINELPSRYRVPFVLCYLQGFTQAQAAREMGCPEGTVATRLSRARQRLRTRLARHGLGVAAGTLALGVWSSTASATLPALLSVSTVRIATVFRAGKASPADGIPAKVAALTKGVSKAMFMTKLRFVLGLVALFVATVGGAGVWTFAAVGSEPTPAAPQPAQVTPPVAEPAPRPIPRALVPQPLAIDEKEPTSAVAYTENFAVHASTRRIAQLLGEAAERSRKKEAERWLGKELPAWSERCAIHVRTTDGGMGGATTFSFGETRVLDFGATSDGGVAGSIVEAKVLTREMHLEGPLDRLLSSCLPHEITHTILADYFRGPVPRWADEGAALMAEDDEEQQRHEQMMWKLAAKSDRFIPVSRLLPMNDFPQDVMPLYAEGHSLTRWLVAQRDRKWFLEFVKHGIKGKDWKDSVWKYYDLEDLDALETQWLADVKKEAKKHPANEEESRPTISSGPPVVGRAVIEKQERLVLRSPVCYYEPKTRYATVPGSQVQHFETSYEMVVKEHVQRFDLKDVEATDADGKKIEKQALAKTLQQETPVLIALDGRKVDPYYLAVVKEGTIVLMPNMKEVQPDALRSAQPPRIDSKKGPR
jgi:RNA polymerase sigma factor (sigma-70 family)